MSGSEFGYHAKFQYDAFGNFKTLVADTQNSGQHVPDANTSGPRYRGQLYDACTDQVYLRNRYYSPGIGRFTSWDPIGYSGGLNTYNYAGSDPVNRWDPMGLKYIWLLWKWVHIPGTDTTPMPPNRDGEYYGEIYPIEGTGARWAARKATQSVLITMQAQQYAVDFIRGIGKEWGAIIDDPEEGIERAGIQFLENTPTTKPFALAINAYQHGYADAYKNALRKEPIVGNFVRGYDLANTLGISDEEFAYRKISLFEGTLTEATLVFLPSLKVPSKAVPLQEMSRSEAVSEIKMLRSIAPTTTAPANSPLLQRYLAETGGRWGNTATRQLNHRIAMELESRGFRVTGGAGRAAEEWFAGPGGGTKGGTFVDITATNGAQTIRVQTVTTLADGVTPTLTEAAAAARIGARFPSDELMLVSKQTGQVIP